MNIPSFSGRRPRHARATFLSPLELGEDRLQSSAHPQSTGVRRYRSVRRADHTEQAEQGFAVLHPRKGSDESDTSHSAAWELLLCRSTKHLPSRNQADCPLPILENAGNSPLGAQQVFTQRQREGQKVQTPIPIL
eukprot:gene9387-biopygen2817